jgi:hypothetical protein
MESRFPAPRDREESRMSRSDARWGVAAAFAGVAGLSLLVVMTFAPADAAMTPASPSPADCGVPASSWGGAIANDVRVDLVRVERIEAPASATPTATATTTFFAELRVENLGDSPASIVVDDITLVLCDGSGVSPVPDSTHEAFSKGELPVGETRTGWIAFALDQNETPVRLIIPISRSGLTGGRVEFPLVILDTGSGVAGTTGSPGAAGADAVGGDAVGGDGADGDDATGAAGDS